ncbi:DUF5995 family protein [Myxococcota bacterium]|nr:DUF5995 family protein [Myxococcota bacterium]
MTVHRAPITIDEVVARLEDLARTEANNGRPSALFATLYLLMTKAVRASLCDGHFRDRALMEQLDVVFASDYFDAFAAWQARRRPRSAAWEVAFRTTERRRPIALQHLLLGMNAHINLDLAVSVARVVPSSKLAAFKPDFDRVNDVMSSLFDPVKEVLGRFSPLLGLLDRLGREGDDVVVEFSLQRARQAAWDNAVRLSELPPCELLPAIRALDHRVAARSRLIARPPLVMLPLLTLVRVPESRELAAIVDALLALDRSEPRRAAG